MSEQDRHLRRLVGLLGRAEGAVPRDWEGLERTLGVALPSDYKDLISKTDERRVADFLWILSPDPNNHNVDLGVQAVRRLDALQQVVSEGERLPSIITDIGADLLPWAITDNGDVAYWLRRPRAAPDEWTILINESRGPDWEAFDCGMVRFLSGWLSREFVSEILSPGFP